MYSYVLVDKTREVYTKKENEIEYNVMIDQIKNIGVFVEFELLANEDFGIEPLTNLLNSFVNNFKSLNLEKALLPYRDYCAQHIYNNYLKDITTITINFDDLIFNRTNTDTVVSSDPIQIFNYLDKKDGFGYLRTNQADFLKEWNERRTERDIVGVMHTGAGKTLVGLLMLQSKLVEEKEPAIYLCPTKQLVEQTVKQASHYGMDVCEIGDDNRIPIEFKNAEKILVTTFSKLFNGKSIFGVKDFTNTASILKIGSVLIDDAHSCVDYARNSSTIIIKNDTPAFNGIFELFKAEIERQSYGKYNSIQRSDASVSIQVPYWEWFSKIRDVKEILNTHFSQESADFEYRMIQNLLDFSRCYISGTQIEITPKYNPIEQIPSFSNAKHRYILSATINEKDLRGGGGGRGGEGEGRIRN